MYLHSLCTRHKLSPTCSYAEQTSLDTLPSFKYKTKKLRHKFPWLTPCQYKNNSEVFKAVIVSITYVHQSPFYHAFLTFSLLLALLLYTTEPMLKCKYCTLYVRNKKHLQLQINPWIFLSLLKSWGNNMNCKIKMAIEIKKKVINSFSNSWSWLCHMWCFENCILDNKYIQQILIKTFDLITVLKTQFLYSRIRIVYVQHTKTKKISRQHCIFMQYGYN